MLEVTELTAGYGPITALDKVSFSAARGQITAVLGANGAGKTTLLRTRLGAAPLPHRLGRLRRPTDRPHAGRGDARRWAFPTCRRAAG